MIGNIHQLTGKPIANPLAKDAVMKVLVSPEEGWKDHVMRVIEISPGGFTPFHSHPWPHINYVIEGNGLLRLGKRRRTSKRERMHSFPEERNTSFAMPERKSSVSSASFRKKDIFKRLEKKLEFPFPGIRAFLSS
jgi:hypothetical protein